MSYQIRAPFLAAAMLLCTAQVQAAELVTNGGFETGDFTDWEQFVNDGMQSISSVNPSSGSFSANLDATSDTPVDTLISTGAVGGGEVSPGERITVRFDVRGTLANGGVAFAEFFSFGDAGGVTAQQILGGAPLPLNPNPDVWTSYEFVVFAAADVGNGVSILLKSSCGDVVGCTADLYFDNASIATESTGDPDADLDLIPDAVDNCTDVANPLQEDADGDSHGNICDADFNNSCGPVNFPDLAIMQAGFFTIDPVLDLNSSGGPVNFADLAIMQGLFFAPPGPSAPGSLCNPIEELAVNGGFETGDFTGWSQFVNDGVQSISTVNPSSGVFSANLNASGNTPIDTLITMANVGIGLVLPADRIRVTFDVRGAVVNGGVAFAEFLSFSDGGGPTAQQILGGGPLPLNPNPEAWTSYEFIVFAGPDVGGGVSLILKSSCGADPGCIADLYFDNASITLAPL